MYSLIITKQMEWSWHAYLNIFNLKIKSSGLYFLLIKKEICFWTKSTHIEKCQQLKTVMWFRSIYKSTLHPVMRIVCQESTDLLKITLEAIGIFNL
jgi:hypothetical protein